MKKLLLTVLIVIATLTLVTGCSNNGSQRETSPDHGGHGH